MNLFLIIFPVFLISTLPQLYQTIQTGQARDFNLANLCLNALGNLLLGIHGLMTGDTGLIVLGSYFVFYYAVLLSYKI
jgi:uncharacterized protein with PQ loop repeat